MYLLTSTQLLPARVAHAIEDTLSAILAWYALYLVACAASTGGSNQGGSCVQSSFNQSLTKHVGICSLSN